MHIATITTIAAKTITNTISVIVFREKKRKGNTSFRGSGYTWQCRINGNQQKKNCLRKEILPRFKLQELFADISDFFNYISRPL